ncbi:MAG: hypothetical protein NC254_07750 [bacterium]|nr:hypothetical protein [bacterium]
MKNLYRIGIFVVVCIVTGVLIIYLFDRFVVGVKDISGSLPQVFEEQAELDEKLNRQEAAGQAVDAAFGARDASGAQQSGTYDEIPSEPAQDVHTQEDRTDGLHAFRGDGTPDAQAVHTEGTDTVVTKTTVYEIEEYDRRTQEAALVVERIPAQYIGMDRQELESALAVYLESPSLRDVERGLKEIRLVSFSPERITVRKSYDPEPDHDYYYLTEERGYVVVYYRNMRTLFCETGIAMEELPARLQQEIRHIKTMETEEELYGFLESYSS